MERSGIRVLGSPFPRIPLHFIRSYAGLIIEILYFYVSANLMMVYDASKLNEKDCRGAPDWVIEVLSPSTTSKNPSKRSLPPAFSLGARPSWPPFQRARRPRSQGEWTLTNPIRKESLYERHGIREYLAGPPHGPIPSPLSFGRQGIAAAINRRNWRQYRGCFIGFGHRVGVYVHG